MNKIFKNIILASAFCFLMIPNILQAAGYCECTITNKNLNASSSYFRVEKINKVDNKEDCLKYDEFQDEFSYSCKWYDENSSESLLKDVPFNELNQLSVSTPQALIGIVIKSVMGILGTITLVMIIYGGFIWMTSSGNSEKTKKARDIIIWASLGIVVIFASYAILNTVLNIFAK